ncbi:MAG: hypothetical protein Q4E16_01715 [Neisseria sp.]|nr:hypothetical protein [Neisseria sp.]
MYIADLRHFFSTDFVIFREFVALCGSNSQASNLLANLFWWSDVAEKEPHRNGWIFKTATDLKKEVGLTRRGYEKARKFLYEKGIIQYKRAGVFGKMHWQINKEQLLRLVCQIRGIPFPEQDSRYQFDMDNFRLDKWIDLPLWNAFIKMREAKMGKKVSIKAKKKLLDQLKSLRKQQLDLKQIMERSIAAEWAGFYAPNAKSLSSEQLQQAKMKAEYQAVFAEKQREAKQANSPPPDTEREAQKIADISREKIREILKKLNQKQ